MESVCTLPARITPSFWPTSKKRCSSRGVCWQFVLIQIIAEVLNLINYLTAVTDCVSNLVFVFQSVVHAKVRVLSAGLLGCAAASPRPLPVARGGHLLEPHQLKLQQQRLENTIRSRWEKDFLCDNIFMYLISAIASQADYMQCICRYKHNTNKLIIIRKAVSLYF